MKRRELVRTLIEYGAVFVREGGKHTLYENPRTGKAISVPRHAEIKEVLAKDLIRTAKL
jgi:predicted RNA binding protein YcfA (HicA-like mRNA interferase family)